MEEPLLGAADEEQGAAALGQEQELARSTAAGGLAGMRLITEEEILAEEAQARETSIRRMNHDVGKIKEVRSAGAEQCAGDRWEWTAHGLPQPPPTTSDPPLLRFFCLARFFLTWPTSWRRRASR